MSISTVAMILCRRRRLQELISRLSHKARMDLYKNRVYLGSRAMLPVDLDDLTFASLDELGDDELLDLRDSLDEAIVALS